MNSKRPTPAVSEPLKDEQVLLLAGELFFVETIDIPDELEISEIPEFAELSLESMAPFPIDRLYWGYLYSKNVPTLLIYAAHRERIKSEGFADPETYTWVIPDFATLAGAHFQEDTLVLLKNGTSVSLAYFENGFEIPKSVWVDSITEPLSEDRIRQFRSEICGLPETVPIQSLEAPIVTVAESGISTVVHITSDQSEDQDNSGHWQTFTPSESQLWQMDVRSTDFKTAEKSNRRMRSLIARVTGWAAVFALALVAVEIALFASQAWLQTQLEQIASQRDAVAKVEEKQILVNKLEQVAQNELRPIEMLEAANTIRLKLKLGIEYDRVVIEGDNHITIEGKASSVGALNRYVAGLEDSGLFEILVTPEPSTDKGETTFRVSLAYSPKAEQTNEISISDPAEKIAPIPLSEKEVRPG